MSDYEVTLRGRLPARWYLALVGLIMLLQGGGVLFGWMPVPRILELLYPNKEPPAFESRDLTWAWVFLIAGGALVAWIVARLVGPHQTIRADGEGVYVPMRGPLRRPTLIPWSHVADLDSRRGSDDFGQYPSVLIEVDDVGLFPPRPWGARWLDDGMLSVSAEGWDVAPDAVVCRLREVWTLHMASSHEDAEVQEEAGEVRMDQQPIAEGTDAATIPTPPEDEEGDPA